MRAFRALGNRMAALRARPTKCARLMRRTAGIDIGRPLPPELCCVRTLLNGVRCRSVSWGTMPDPAEARLAEVCRRPIDGDRSRHRSAYGAWHPDLPGGGQA